MAKRLNADAFSNLGRQRGSLLAEQVGTLRTSTASLLVVDFGRSNSHLGIRTFCEKNCLSKAQREHFYAVWSASDHMGHSPKLLKIIGL